MKVKSTLNTGASVGHRKHRGVQDPRNTRPGPWHGEHRRVQALYNTRRVQSIGNPAEFRIQYMENRKGPKH